MLITSMKSEIRLAARSYYLMLKAARIAISHGTKMVKDSCLKEKGILPLTLSLLLLADMRN